MADLKEFIGGWLNLRLAFDISAVPTEPDDYSLHGTGQLIFSPHEIGDDDDPVRVGTISFWIIDPDRAVEGGFSTYDAFDAPTSETADILSLLNPLDPLESGERAEFASATIKALREEPYSLKTLLFSRMEIEPKWRGQGIGLIAVNSIIDCFGSTCAVVVCKPFPIQFENCVTKDNHSEYVEARSAITKYWRRLGSRSVKGTRLMVLNPSMRRPSLEKIMIKLRADRADSSVGQN
jgi:hypothetical protein